MYPRQKTPFSVHNPRCPYHLHCEVWTTWALISIGPWVAAINCVFVLNCIVCLLAVERARYGLSMKSMIVDWPMNWPVSRSTDGAYRAYTVFQPHKLTSSPLLRLVRLNLSINPYPSAVTVANTSFTRWSWLDELVRCFDDCLIV